MKTPWIGLTAGWVALAVMTYGCSSSEKQESPVSDNSQSTRVPAAASANLRESVDNEPVSIKYFTYKNGLASEVDVITPQRWAGLREGGRTSFLSKFYFANTTTKSNRGLGHVVCFTGSAQAVVEGYMDPKRADHTVAELADGLRVPLTAASDNGMVLGVRFKMLPSKAGEQKPDYFFRMSQCTADKGGIGTTAAPRATVTQLEPATSLQTSLRASLQTSAKAALPRAPANAAVVGAATDGFSLEDQPEAADIAKVPVRFKLAADYERIKVRPTDRPWRGMDISTPEGAYRFALLLQKYAYEGMFENAGAPSDVNLRAEKNTVRDWCHMPWQSTGPKGREWVHGMTKEFDLKPSPTIDIFKGVYPGSNWGVAYYNSFACKTLLDVFGPAKARLKAPDFSKAELFGDASVIVKFLFTTAQVPGTEGALKMTSHVSGPGSNVRGLSEVRHVQMDISIRDTTLKGASSDLSHWVMLSYYYDPTYNAEKDIQALLGVRNPILDVANLPPAMKHMRPQGISTNFDAPTLAKGADAKYAAYTGHSIIFKNAQTNEVGARLNGPVDNPLSSCLGCHATAGTRMKSVPGVLDFASWLTLRPEAKLDFNQQMRKAQENYQSQILPVAQ